MLAKEKNIKNFHMEGDFKIIINNLCNVERCPYNIYSILNDYRRIILDNSMNIKINHIFGGKLRQLIYSNLGGEFSKTGKQNI